MKRDFSRVKIEELQADIIDFTSDYLKDLGKVIDLEDMDIMEKIVFIKAMESFENKLEEKKLVSANKLVEIITNVKELEKTFAEYLGTLNEQLDAYDKRLQSVIEMLKPEKLSMNNLQYMDEMLKIGKAYQNAKENSQLINVEIWLNPNYRMSEDDLVIAQEMLDEYFAEGTEAEKRFFAESEYDWIEEMANDDWTDEEWHRYQLMCALYTKMDTIRSISAGAVEGVPFCGELFDWSSRMQADIYGYEFEELCSMDNVFANSHTQHPFATFGGNIIGNLLTYNVAAGAARNIPGLSQRISNLSGKLSTYPVLNRIGRDHLTNIIGGTIIETSISTVPGMVKDVWNGESADNVFRNAGLDIGRNLLFNIGGEAVSAAIGKVLTKVPEEVQRIFPKSVEENADDVAEAALKSGKTTINGLEIIDGKVDGKIPLAEYEKYRVASVHNVDSNIMTLGKYEPTIRADGTKDFSVPGPGAYTVKAGDTTYFSLGTEWDKITDTYGLDAAGQNMFDYFNKPALDDAVSAGKEIRFSHNPEAYGECALKWEWDYLQEKHGYFALEKRGDFWYATK